MQFNKTKIGILGGGQLGKMLCLSAANLHLEIHILDSAPCSAQNYCTQFVEGNFKNYEDVLVFGRSVDVITVEIEHVNIEALEVLEREGKKVYPSTHALKTIIDKGTQKEFYLKNNIPTVETLFFSGKKQLIKHYENNFSPFVWKSRREGYDGKGVIFVKTQNFDSLPDTPCIAETPVKIKKEISILLARNINGEIAFFPATEMIFEESANLLLFQTCPADISNYVELEAQYYAERIATELEIVGLLAVEFFLTDEDKLVVNEVAPRPHNSGHHTIEACDTSQFEQHLRAILNFPLGSTELRKPAALLNLLGAEGFSGEPIYKNYGLILKIDDAHLHLYGKQTTKPFRKMGHLTVLNDDVKKALEIVKKIHQQISCES